MHRVLPHLQFLVISWSQVRGSIAEAVDSRGAGAARRGIFRGRAGTRIYRRARPVRPLPGSELQADASRHTTV